MVKCVTNKINLGQISLVLFYQFCGQRYSSKDGIKFNKTVNILDFFLPCVLLAFNFFDDCVFGREISSPSTDNLLQSVYRPFY